MKFLIATLASIMIAAPSFAGSCKDRVIDKVEGMGLEIESISLREVYNGRDDSSFKGYRAEIRTTDGEQWGALTNRSCSHIRVFKYWL